MTDYVDVAASDLKVKTAVYLRPEEYFVVTHLSVSVRDSQVVIFMCPPEFVGLSWAEQKRHTLTLFVPPDTMFCVMA